jgi:hypothetical protein
MAPIRMAARPARVLRVLQSRPLEAALGAACRAPKQVARCVRPSPDDKWDECRRPPMHTMFAHHPTPWRAAAQLLKCSFFIMCARARHSLGRATAQRVFVVDRKVTKKAVMVLPNGRTFKSRQQFIGEAVRERIAAGAENPFGDELNTPSRPWKGRVASIGDVVVAARAAVCPPAPKQCRPATGLMRPRGCRVLDLGRSTTAPWKCPPRTHCG